jgi:hypothetical protein
MIKNIILLVALATMFALSGCSSKEPLYYYGDYSEEYYNYKKNMSPETQLELQKAIEEAIEDADDGSSERVAPGMYANLGYIYLKSGNTAKAKENFIKEKTLYPEAKHFMDRLIQKIDALEGDDNEK